MALISYPEEQAYYPVLRSIAFQLYPSVIKITLECTETFQNLILH